MTLTQPWQHGQRTPGDWLADALAAHTARSDEVEHSSRPEELPTESGSVHAYRLTFRDNAERVWAVVVTDHPDAVTGDNAELEAEGDGTGDQLPPLAEGEHTGPAVAGERLEVDDLGPGLDTDELPAGAGGVGELGDQEEAATDG